MYSRGLLGPLGLGGARCTAGHGPRAFNLCDGGCGGRTSLSSSHHRGIWFNFKQI